MTPRISPPVRRYAEPEITPPSGWRPAPAVAPGPSRVFRSHHPQLETFGIIVLAPAIIALSVAILLTLLDIFVIWLCVVGILFAVTVLADLAHRWWRWARPSGALYHRPLGYPGR